MLHDDMSHVNIHKVYSVSISLTQLNLSPLTSMASAKKKKQKSKSHLVIGGRNSTAPQRGFLMLG